MKPGETSVRATLDAWREQGSDRCDPVRFHLIEALERRAAGHSGEVRRLLDKRLDTLVEAYAADVESAASRSCDAAAPVSPCEPERSALTALGDYRASHMAQAGSNTAYPELEALEYFRQVWSKVRTQKQLRQSLEQVPGNAGPLNSSSLVHRSLSLMRELSPGYLQQFLSYVDTLSWMEQLTGGGALTEKESPRAGSATTKKSTRSKSR